MVGLTREGSGYALYAQQLGSATDAWAGRFRADSGNGVWITTPSGQTGLTVEGGSKNAAVSTDAGDRLLYSEESTEVWFTDYGFGQLVDGTAVITIDPLFAQTVTLAEPYHVFVQAYGDADLYVTERTPTIGLNGVRFPSTGRSRRRRTAGRYRRR